MATNVSKMENIAYKLNVLYKQSDETQISKILSILFEKYKHFWNYGITTEKKEKTLTNLTARLLNEEQVVSFLTQNNNSKLPDTWVTDSGSYSHVINNKINKLWQIPWYFYWNRLS